MLRYVAMDCSKKKKKKKVTAMLWLTNQNTYFREPCNSYLPPALMQYLSEQSNGFFSQQFNTDLANMFVCFFHFMLTKSNAVQLAMALDSD